MDGRWVVVAAINGLLAVVAGAFGAHALREHLTERSMATFETAARYQMYHALALLAVAALLANSQSRSARVAGIFMLAGIALFSGSLYWIALCEDAPAWLGPVTPIGGVFLMLGWFSLAISGFRAARGGGATRA
ncbi:MAG: DUF423 domain-containing protein [Planctomycetes bacterium]|nr:DUF423 domain-containing protein [Planctomycetota bacterium]